MNNPHFNIRVYGILVHHNRILINEERIKGILVTKLPGGGLQFGEGTHDCLIREWKEELGIDIVVTDHFYTTDFYQPSAFDDSQVLSIYYFVAAEEIPETIVNHVAGEKTSWLNLQKVSGDSFTLPIDKKVGAMLRSYFLSGKL
jgi:8-oxo-dGTP diphosphatase